MHIKKALLGALSFLVIIGGTNYLMNQFTGGSKASAADYTMDGGAAQFVGKVDIKNSPYFAQPDIYNLVSNEHLTVLSHYKTLQQNSGYSCGPVAAATVVQHFEKKQLHTEAEICRIMGTSTTRGTTTRGMMKYFEELGWEVHSSAKDRTPQDYEAFLAFVQENLKNNTPIMVENIDWGGHWRVIIGYDTMGTESSGDDVLLLADPFDTGDHLQDGYNTVPAERFFYSWFDHQLFKKGEQDKQWLTAKPKK